MLSDLEHPVEPRTAEPTATPPPPTAMITQLTAKCFICKKQLTHSNTPNTGTITREDVFPKWLWKKFQLQNEVIDFPHGGNEKYPNVLVPCCRTCNSKWMRQVETRISQAVAALDEYPEFMQLSRSDVALWLSKIAYGLLAASVWPWRFNSQSALPPKLPATVFDQYQLVAKLLAGFRKRVIISASAFPISILKFHVKSGGNARLNYDYRDSIEWPTALAIRMGSIGVIASFEDFGYLEHWYKQTLASLLDGAILHPRQFSEVVARAFYNAGLGGFNIGYSLSEGPDDVHMWLTPIATDGRPEDPQRLADMMADFTGVENLRTIDDGNRHRSLLVGANGFRDIPFVDGTVQDLQRLAVP